MSTALLLVLELSKVLLRLEAAECTAWMLRRVPRFVLVPRVLRRPLVAGAVGVGAMVEGVLAHLVASMLSIGGRMVLSRLDAATLRGVVLRRMPHRRGEPWRPHRAAVHGGAGAAWRG